MSFIFHIFTEPVLTETFLSFELVHEINVIFVNKWKKTHFSKTLFLKVHQERDSETRIKVFVLELILKC